MRTCPKCAHLSSNRAEWCEACGYQIVLHLTAQPKPRPKPEPRRRKARPIRQHPTDQGWDGVGRLCPLHGDECEVESCEMRSDLIESGLL